MLYNKYVNMTTAEKDQMVNGADVQQQIKQKYNNFKEKEKDDRIRTPKRHYTGEPRTTIDNNHINMSNNEDEDEEYQIVSHQRKKIQRGNKDNQDKEHDDVINNSEELNHIQQLNTQKRKNTLISRTFVNGELTAMNHHLKRTEKKKYDIQMDQANYLKNTHDDNNRLRDPIQQRNPNDQETKFFISNHALQYAVEQHLPPISIKCEPKIDDQKYATSIIKEFFSKIEKEFRTLNNKYAKPLGFDYWFIDRDGNLQCFTREIEMFVYLCGSQNYPDKLLNTTIIANPPKRLPPQCSIILKHIPRNISIEDIKNEISTKYHSMRNIEEMRGSVGRTSRHVRIEMISHDEYTKLLNSGVLAIGGQLIEAAEFLAPPRILICSRCNTPGHTKKDCKMEIDICRRCGGNKKQGEHKECIIKCHHCNGNHESTSFECPLIADFRKELILKLKNKPNLLPHNVQLFIPTEFRSRGEKNNRILINNTKNACLQRQQQNIPLHEISNLNEWPYLPKNVDSQIHSTMHSSILNKNIWNEMMKTQNEFELLKAKYNEQEKNIMTRYNEQKIKLGSILSLMSVQIQQQQENLKTVCSTLNELIPVATMSLEISQQLFSKAVCNSSDNFEKLSLETIAQQIKTSITFLNEQKHLITDKHSQFLNNFEQNKKLLHHGIELYMSNNE